MRRRKEEGPQSAEKLADDEEKKNLPDGNWNWVQTAVFMTLLAAASQFRLTSCCQGEWFLVIPGLGAWHIPLAKNVLHLSVGLPSIVAAYLLIGFLLHCVLPRGASGKRSPAMTLAATLLLVPVFVRSPIGDSILVAAWTKGHNESPVMLDKPRFAKQLFNHTPPGLALYQNREIMSVDDARGVAERVLALKNNWYLQMVFGLGSPHFSLGVKYGGIYAGGRFRKAFAALTDNKMLWGEFGDLYEKMRSGVSRELDAPVRLHKWLWPPSFLIWYTNVGFKHALDVHFDGNLHDNLLKSKDLSDFPQRMVMSIKSQEFAKSSTAIADDAVKCHWDQQHTLVVPLRVPGYGGGLDVWRYRADNPECSISENPEECIEQIETPYREGKFTMFTSHEYHSAKPWAQALLDLEPRVIVVGFVIPCDVNGAREYQLIGSLTKR